MSGNNPQDSTTPNNNSNSVDVNENSPNHNEETKQNLEDRKAPEGKDNDSFAEKQLVEYKNGQQEILTTDVNGKVTVVHVVVTINGNGTLADLKKQRMQIRNSTSDVNSLSSPVSTISDTEVVNNQPNNMDIIRFTGETDEIVGYPKRKRCCIIQ